MIQDTSLPFFFVAAANKEELLEMITHGAEKIINASEEYVIFPHATTTYWAFLDLGFWLTMISMP
jgi:hypothetical protein